MIHKRFLTLALAFGICSFSILLGQDAIVEGYVFEADNRGYLNEVRVVLHPKDDPTAELTVFTNRDGFFTANVPLGKTYTFTADKSIFHPTRQDFSTVGKEAGEKVFVKVELARQPGYMFDVTLAEVRIHEDSITDAIAGAWIEIYNNTSKEEVLNLKDYPDPNFNYTFQQGNHYTMLIRKKGYFSKRLEAFVNVDGCILCFDGLASLENVTDNLTEGHEMGSLLANIELRRANVGDKFTVDNILYEYNSADITSAAASELNNLADILEDNPDILVELGSHTDSRGKPGYNQTLSTNRAKSAVAHLILQGIDPGKITARGYGESELLNDCGDGSDCSEPQHAENRRTEIKVLGFLGSEEKDKTLVELKEEESFAALLREVTEQEQYQVQEGEELPEDMKQLIKESAEEIEEQQATKEVSEEDAMKAAADVVEEEGAIMVLEGLAEDETGDSLDTENTEIEVFNEASPKAQLELKSERMENRADVAETSVMDSLEERLIKEQYTVYSSPEEIAKPIESDYNGFLIHVLESEVKLGPGHPIFKKYDNVWVENKQDGNYNYLVGSYSGIQEAMLGLDEDLLRLYPKSQIIQYVDGARK